MHFDLNLVFILNKNSLYSFFYEFFHSTKIRKKIQNKITQITHISLLTFIPFHGSNPFLPHSYLFFRPFIVEDRMRERGHSLQNAQHNILGKKKILKKSPFFRKKLLRG